jgi:hypothetical protein
MACLLKRHPAVRLVSGGRIMIENEQPASFNKRKTEKARNET